MTALKEKWGLLRTVLSEESKRKYVTVFIIILIGAALCELFIFNFKWIGSISANPVSTDNLVLSGISQRGDKLTISGDNASVEFKNVNKKVKYLYFCPGDKDNDILAAITVSAVDEANAYGIYAPSRMVISSVKPTQYVRLHFSGEVDSVKIDINNMNGRTISTSDIGLNIHVPLMFSWMRFITLVIICMLLYMLRPKSPLYAIVTNLKDKRQRACVVVLLIVQIFGLLWAIHWNTVAVRNLGHIYANDQYYELTDAFKKGNLYIDDKPSEALRSMKNPYDTSARTANDIEYKWDAAYYDGKYYSYFGAAPAVLLYLPYNIVTGKELPNHTALFIFSVLTIPAIMALLWEIIKKWYRKTPFIVYLLMSFIFPIAANLTYIVHKPDFYTVPNASALMFAIWGLTLWISAERVTERNTIHLSPVRLAAGSVCVAMTSLCRPQFLLTTVFGIIFFWDYAFKKRTLFSKRGINQTLAVCLPFVIIGLITMWYNFARFGSPFDFGANYNLTTNDMTHRGLVFGRTGLGLFLYLFQPPHITSVFPFIQDFIAENTYQGLTIIEWQMCGAFWLYPITVLGVYGTFNKNLFIGDKRIYRFVYFSVIMAVIIIIVDTQMAGLLPRYFTDFTWLLMLASTITIFALFNNNTEIIKRSSVIKLIILLSAVTLIMSLLYVFASSDIPLKTSNVKLFYSLQSMIAFWM